MRGSSAQLSPTTAWSATPVIRAVAIKSLASLRGGIVKLQASARNDKLSWGTIFVNAKRDHYGSKSKGQFFFKYLIQTVLIFEYRVVTVFPS